MEFFAQSTQKGNQTLKNLLPMIRSNHHNHLKFYCFFSIFPYYTEKIEEQGEQYRGGGGSKSQAR